MALGDVPAAVEDILPASSLALLKHLLESFELDARLLPSFKAALRSLEQADSHLRTCAALAETLGGGR